MGFLSDKYRIFSGGDDYSSNLWDIPSATEIISYSEHTDYVRCGCASKVNADVFVTGLGLFSIYILNLKKCRRVGFGTVGSCLLHFKHGGSGFLLSAFLHCFLFACFSSLTLML